MDAAIVGAGMLTAVGLCAAEVAASVRAGVSRCAEGAWVDGLPPFVLARVPDEGLGPGDGGFGAGGARLPRLGGPALAECLSHLPADAAPPPLILAVPETMRGVDGDRLLDGLAACAGGFDRATSEAFHRGRAGGVRALARAADRLGADTPFVLAGGVDSYVDPALLESLAKDGRLRTEGAPDGFVPGEGAAFVLLARGGWPGALARIAGSGRGTEPGHLHGDAPFRGDGLAGAVAAALAGASEPVRDAWSSMNGERYWAREWGVAAVRNADALADDAVLHHPAECHGDTGAASGPLLAALAAMGIAEGHGRAPALVCASSEGGERAALLIHPP